MIGEVTPLLYSPKSNLCAADDGAVQVTALKSHAVVHEAMETQTISDPLGWFSSDTRHQTNNLVNVDILYLIAISPLDCYWQPSSLLLGGIMPTIMASAQSTQAGYRSV